MTQALLAALVVFNHILDAGNTITAFSLLLYGLTFNLRERVARTFALLLTCITIVYFTDVLVGSAQTAAEQEMWLRLQWIGIAFVPTAFLHFSDSLLAATGRPSRGRRRLAIRLNYLGSAGVVAVAALTPLVAGGLVLSGPAAHLSPGPLFPLFCLFFLVDLSFTGLNLWRAHQRCLTSTSRRRMRYLMAGCVAPIPGVFPFLMLMGTAPLGLPGLFWTVVGITNLAAGASLILMAYVVAYYGVSNPDRVVKGRLFEWILRGPVVASTVLAATVVLDHASRVLGMPNSRAVLFAMVAILLLLQYFITLVRAPIERWLFYGEDRQDVNRLQLLEARLLTTGDLRQFLEAILNAACDITGARSAFAAAIGPAGLDLEVAVGPDDPLRGPEELTPLLSPDRRRDFADLGSVFTWESYWLIPLRTAGTGEAIGLLGLRARSDEPDFDAEEAAALHGLADKAAVALTDRMLQREVFAAVDRLVPEVEAIQRIRAAARYGSPEALVAAVGEPLPAEADLAYLVRDALAHYWGGPRLSQSPLLRLRVVRQALEEHNGNPVNALRAILRSAIERTRPEGQRRFTAEWVLYNILEMKFLEGRKVRDVAMRLAVSEADLYRKQRVAIEAVARAVAEMEQEVQLRPVDSQTGTPDRAGASE
jgi:hypothetical protein